ncbi:hypothetical protein R52603_05575 [Paraburkholderia saeva]|nr:hypothetical protein R70241_05012 [Paraburkholderia saeva]CAG4927436.1 hypothetical protein R52603_05575 [Paraburkholderia saeva]
MERRHKPPVAAARNRYMKREEDMKLIFVGDPMCSWCYGFGKEMAAVVESMPGLEVQIVVGGMGAGSTQVLDDAGKRFRLKHRARVEEVSGAEFNRDALIARENFVYDTEPVCRAVVAARIVAPACDPLKVFRAMQRVFYVDGLDTIDGKVLSRGKIQFRTSRLIRMLSGWLSLPHFPARNPGMMTKATGTIGAAIRSSMM